MTVAELLLGIYSQELYDKKQRRDIIEKDLGVIAQEIKAIKKFINNPYFLIPSHIKSLINNKENEIASIEENIISLKNEEKTVRYTKKTKLEFEVLNEDAIKQRTIFNRLEDDVRNLEFEIEDSKDFIRELNNNRRV